MAFLYLIDLITSISLHIIVKCTSLIIHSSGNGLYYLYKKIRPGSLIKDKTVMINDNEYMIISRDEYNKLISNQSEAPKVEEPRPKVEEPLSNESK